MKLFKKRRRSINCMHAAEAAVGRCSSKHMFLKISKYLFENNCASVSFLINLQARPTFY